MTLERFYWNRTAGYNAFSQGNTTLYAPELLRNAWGLWDSTLHIMNVGNNTAHLTVKYYAYNGAFICADSRTLPANRHLAIEQAGNNTCVKDHGYDLFSAVIVSDQPLVAVVNQDNATHRDLQAYNAIIGGEGSLALPLIRKGPYAGENWNASVIVQDTGNAPLPGNPVTLTFYDREGNRVGQASATLSAHGAHLFYAEIPTGFSGSVVIETDCADCSIVALGSLFNEALSSDGAMKYSALVRKAFSTLGVEEPAGE